MLKNQTDCKFKNVRIDGRIMNRNYHYDTIERKRPKNKKTKKNCALDRLTQTKSHLTCQELLRSCWGKTVVICSKCGVSFTLLVVHESDLTAHLLWLLGKTLHRRKPYFLVTVLLFFVIMTFSFLFSPFFKGHEWAVNTRVVDCTDFGFFSVNVHLV